MATLKAKNLCKRFSGVEVVKDVSLRVSTGQIVGLLGPNGAGKSVSFYMLAGLIRADKGQVWMDDQEIGHLGLSYRVQYGIGYLPQQSSIFKGLSASDNIEGVLELRGDLSASERKNKLAELIDKLDVHAFARTKGGGLSGGEARRVEFARLLAMNPRILLLDEPYAGVDPITVFEINELVKKMRDEHLGVLITDHNVRDTIAICDDVYVLMQGCVCAKGDPNQVLEHPIVRERFLGENF